MQKSSKTATHRSLLLSLFILGLFAALFIVPYQFRSEAVVTSQDTRGFDNVTRSHDPNIPNYDIREQKSDETHDSLMKFRGDIGKSASAIADVKDSFVRGEESLRTTVKSLKVEYSPTLRQPEVITPDVYKANIERLSGPASGIKNAEILRNFAKQNNSLIGMDDSQLENLKVLADYTNPRRNMSFAHLEQRINDVPVFAGELKAGITMNGEIVRVINNLAPGLDYESLSSDFRDPLDAVRAAAGHINYKLQRPDVTRNDSASSDSKVVFGKGDSATTAERMYFPTEIGVAVPAWRVLIWQPVNAYYVIVDAETGTMLWRKNITEDQTESATYNVYDNTNAFMNAADSPAPLTPGPLDPGTGTQGAIGTRTDVTLIGNEGDLSFNDEGWITDGANGTDGWTDGNHTEAGLDIAGGDGVDAPMNGTGRVFTSAWNPPPGSPPPGEAPTVADSQFGAVVQMFYVMNRYHDELYKVGFTEDAFNFQDDNFTHGGAGGDRIRSEGQDQAGTNNANMSTPADGGRGRMQMFRFTGPTPDHDGTADADVIIHETSHGTSNRLHGNTAGLGSNMSRGMGEGWGDWYAHTLLAEPTDPINGLYTTGGYATKQLTGAGDLSNYYYGIRRFPKAVLAFTGGPGSNPHNPLTFADLNAGCVLSDGAFPPGPIGSATCDQVHNAGEVWSSHLWEVRALMVTRLGFTAGTTRVLQVVTDGMKLAPINPTFIQERDAIIAAAAALPIAPEASADVADVREGFRIRGMGFSAEVLATSPANVIEAFDTPNVRAVDPITITDAPGGSDGFPEPGETVTLTVPVENPNTGATITNVGANVNGGTGVPYGDIADGATVTRDIQYAIPGGAVCGSFHTVQINVMSDSGVQAPLDYTFRLGAPVGGPPTTFNSTGAFNIPAGQPGSTSGPADPYPSTIAVAGLTGNKVISIELTDLSHEWVGDVDVLLEAPNGAKMIIMSDAFSASNDPPVVTTLTLRDDAMDTMVTGGTPPPTGTFQPFNSGANDPFDAPAPAGPYENPAPGGAATFLSAYGMDGAAMNGDWKLYIDDDAGADPGIMAGWKITFESDNFNCDPDTPSSGNGRADFDGDGRTDLSVFRPSEGNWYVNGSTDGFSALHWGLSGDIPVPGDYDGDGKDDHAVFRPSADEADADFYILNSNGFVIQGASWGVPGDIPVVGDYDGDGRDDIAIWRDSDTTWYAINSGGGTTIQAFGTSGDTPIAGDFDGDGTTDFTTFNAGAWSSMLSGGGTENVTVGAAGDTPLAGDFDGDGQDDQATFRDSNGTWYAWYSSTSAEVVTPFGTSGDIPTPGDYDGDGSDDVAIYRSGQWWVNGSTSGVSVQNFGLASDLPIPGPANP